MGGDSSSLPTTTPDIMTAQTIAPPVIYQESVCVEDEPCWDCEVMGNRICGTTSTRTTRSRP